MRPRRLALLLLLCPVLAGPGAAGGSPARPVRADLKLFDYDRRAPLGFERVGSERRGGVRLQDIRYASPRGGKVTAYLAVPAGRGPFAGILLQHGLPGSRDGVAGYAVELARTGAVVLAIDAPFARRPARTGGLLYFTERDRDEQVQLIVDLRRGVDLLVSRPDVDRRRLAYIGFSYGGAMGGLLAGVEKRIGSYVLAVGDGGLVAHFTGEGDAAGPLSRLPAEQRRRWLAAMEPVEPLRFVGSAAPSALFFQSARRDEYVPPEDARRYQAAGSEPKRVQWYDTGHSLDAAALRDQVSWLAGRIGIDAEKLAATWRRAAGR